MISILITIIPIVLSQCSPLVVNNFQRERNNSINGLSYDDNSLQQFTINNSVLEIIPKPNGYYFETGFCPQYRQSWSGVEIEMTALENTEFYINFQTNKQFIEITMLLHEH
jgi:hypothetical protein